MTRDVVVRAAAAGDAALLSELGARTFRDTFGPDNTASDMDAYLAGAFSPDIQAHELEDPGTTFLIAWAGDEAVGYARMRTGRAPASVIAEHPVEIVRFYVVRDRIGTGVGRMLMRECLSRAGSAGCDAVWLDVWERNTKAIGFYANAGFEVVGTQEFVLGGDVQHDLLMAREVG